MSKIRQYPGERVGVTWDGRLCIHVGECGRAANQLFVSGRDPWCAPDQATVDQAISTVESCPTGSLAYERHDGGTPEQVAPDNTVVVANNGPLYVRGQLAIQGVPADMPGVAFRAALCRCGASKNKPFCDNSHEAANFVDHGAIGGESPGREQAGGELEVNVAPNGPLLLQGNVQLVTSSGRVAWEGTKCALCRCGASKNKPFCDGSHRDAGFDSSV